MSPRPPIEPWWVATARFEAAESSARRRERDQRAATRTALTLHVPPTDAPDQARLDQTDWTGRVGSCGRPRAPVSMRLVLALWARGHGAHSIRKISADTDTPAARSTIDRLIAQARAPFPGAEPIPGADLASELAARIDAVGWSPADEPAPDTASEPAPRPVPPPAPATPDRFVEDFVDCFGEQLTPTVAEAVARRVAGDLFIMEPEVDEPPASDPLPGLDPWLPALVAHEAAETSVQRLRRQKLAARRLDATLFLPRPDAPGTPTPERADRFGRLTGPGRPMNPLPMRIILALWAQGHGTPAIRAIAAGAGIRAPRSTIEQLFERARALFPGAELTSASALTAHIAGRRPDGAPQAGSLAARMHAWRARYRVNKTEAARLAHIRPALWIRLERGHQPRFDHVRDAVERLIATQRTITP